MCVPGRLPEPSPSVRAEAPPHKHSVGTKGLRPLSPRKQRMGFPPCSQPQSAAPTPCPHKALGGLAKPAGVLSGAAWGRPGAARPPPPVPLLPAWGAGSCQPGRELGMSAAHCPWRAAPTHCADSDTPGTTPLPHLTPTLSFPVRRVSRRRPFSLTSSHHSQADALQTGLPLTLTLRLPSRPSSKLRPEGLLSASDHTSRPSPSSALPTPADSGSWTQPRASLA